METKAIKLLKEHKDKTRVLIIGNQNIVELLLHILSFCGVEADYLLNDGKKHIQQSDFFIWETNDTQIADFSPNIVLLATKNSDENPHTELIENIVGGGILVYPDQDENLVKNIEKAENYFRKIPYNYLTPVGGSIETSIGQVPISFSENPIVAHLEGVKLLAQQLGIMEEEFYEATMVFQPK